MTEDNIKNNFEGQNFFSLEKDDFVENNKLTLTILFTIIMLFVLGVQLLPYFYGGSVEHFHSHEECGWPNGCGK